MQTIPSHQVRVLDGAGPGPYSIFLLCPTVLPRCRRVHGHSNQHSHLIQTLFVMLPAICNLHPHDLILLTIFWTPPSGSIELNNSFSSQVRLALSVGSWGLVARWLGSCQVEPCRAAAVRIVLVRVPQFWHLDHQKTATTAGLLFKGERHNICLVRSSLLWELYSEGTLYTFRKYQCEIEEVYAPNRAGEQRTDA